MKHLSLTLSGASLIGVVILFFLHLCSTSCLINESETEAATKEESEDQLAPTAVIAYVNTDSLWENYIFVKDMQDEMAAEKLKMEGQFNHELKKLEKEFTEFQEKAAYMTMEQGKKKQAELMEKEQNLLKMEERLNRKFSESEKKKNKQIQVNIRDFLSDYSKEKGFHYILGYNLYGNVLYADNVLDITTEVIEALNNSYQSEVKNETGKQ